MNERYRQTQIALAELGYNPGPADGIDGPQTDAAIKAYALDTLGGLQRTSPQGLAACASYEGIVPGPYLDSKGIWTAWIGHTAAAGPPDPEALPRGTAKGLGAALLAAVVTYKTDMAACEARVRRAFTRPLEQHQFDAAVSFDLNTGAILRATWVQSANAGQFTRAAKEIMNWRKPTSIVRRREHEQAMFRDGVYPGTPIAVWGVDVAGRVDWSAPLRRITVEDFAAMAA